MDQVLDDPAPCPASASASCGHLASGFALRLDGDRARWAGLGAVARHRRAPALRPQGRFQRAPTLSAVLNAGFPE